MNEMTIKRMVANDIVENFSYQRKFSVKNLFEPKAVVKGFTVLSFKNFLAFFNFLQKGLHVKDSSKEYIFICSSADELEKFISVIKPTKLFEDVMITIQPSSPEALLAIASTLTDDVAGVALSLTPAEVNVLTALMQSDKTLPIHKFFLRPGQQKSGNWGWVRSYWKPDTYGEAYEEILKAVLANPFFRYLDLQIDYEAFEDSPISEIHKLFFYFVNLKNWASSTISMSNDPFNAMTKIEIKSLDSDEKCENCDENCSGDCGKDGCNCNPTNEQAYKVGIVFKNREGCLKGIVSEDLSIDLDDKGTWSFPLGKYLDYSGESLPIKELNSLRALLDLQFQLPEKSNMYFVDIAANIRIMKDPYMLPYLTKLVLEWLQLTISA